MINYPIFYNINPIIENQQPDNYKTKLFINIIIFKYYKELSKLNKLNNNNLLAQIQNQLSNQIDKIIFNNPYYKDLFISLNEFDLSDYNNISKDLILSYIDTQDFFNKSNSLSFAISNIINLIYNNKIKEGCLKLFKFYPDEDKILYSFNNFHFNNTISSNISVLFNNLLDNVSTIEELIRLLSCFYIEAKPTSIYRSFTSFSIFELCRIYEINHNINNLYIDEIRFFDIIKNRLSYLDNSNKQYFEIYEFFISHLKNNKLSVENIDNNNMNSWKMFNDIFLISLEDDDDNVDDSATDDDSANDNDIDDDSANDDNNAIDDDDTNDDDIDDNATDDDSVNDDNNTDDSTTDNDTDDSATDNNKKTNYKQYIRYKLKLVSDEESLEDFLYKIALYKKIYDYVYIKNTTVNIKKIEILKKWISKWIFLTSLSETTTLLKQLKLKNF